MADGEILAPDMEEETSETLSGTEQVVMFDTQAGKRALLSVLADYIAEHGEIDGESLPTVVDGLKGIMGSLDDLTTEQKASLVAAINEVNGKFKDVTTSTKLKKLVTGNPIVVDDALGEVDSLGVSLLPVQDLHGYDKPWSAGAGRNLLNVGGRVNQTTAQVIYTSDDDYVILNGTKQGGGYANLTTLTITLPAGTYYAKAIPVSGTATANISVYPFDGSADVVGNIFDSEESFTLSEEKTFYFRFAVWTDGTVFTNYKVGIVVSKTSDIDKFYPYENICPITGRTQTDVVDTGKNQLDVSTIKNLPSSFDYYDSGYNCKRIQLKPNTEYTVSQRAGVAASTPIILINKYSHVNEAGFLDCRLATAQATYTTDNTGCLYIGVLSGTSNSVFNTRIEQCKVQIEYGSTATDYAEYVTPTTKTVTLPHTVYGADVDVTGGAGQETQKCVDMSTLNWSFWQQSSTQNTFYVNLTDKAVGKKNMITSIYEVLPTGGYGELANGQIVGADGNAYVYLVDNRYNNVTDFKNGVAGQTLCYELATPTDLQTTPTDVELFKGDNVVSGDGDMNMTYVRDIAMVINKIESQL